jgi:hypothetical protein
MKKLALLTLMVFVLSLTAWAGPFSDVPYGHWAYNAVSKLVSKGIIKGYPDNTFKGNKPVTRYEVAMMIAKALGEIKSGKANVSSTDLATLEKLTVEFSDELALLGVKVTALEDDTKAMKKDIADLKSKLASPMGNGYGKVSISGDYRIRINYQQYDNDTTDTSSNDLQADTVTAHRLGLNIFTNIDENVSAFVRYEERAKWSDMDNYGIGNLRYAYVDIDNLWKIGDLRLGRQNVVLGHGIVVADQMDGIRFDKVIDRVKVSLMAMDNKNDESGSMTFYPYDVDTTSAPNAWAYTAANDVVFYVTPYQWPSYNTGDSNGNGTYDNAWDGVAVDVDGDYESQAAFNAGGDYTDLDNPADGVFNNNDILHSFSPARDFRVIFGAGLAGNAEAESSVASQSVQNLDEQTLTDVYGNTVTYDKVGFTKDWSMENDKGFNFFAIAASVDVGGHRLGAYYAQNKYNHYDPYTRYGDPFAAIADINGDGVIDQNDLEAPAATPNWWGLTLDGNVLKNLDYFFEYTSFDSDISNVGLTKDNILDYDSSKSFATNNMHDNMDDGTAWILGINWDITEKYNLIASYGEGDEEFMPLSIDPELAFNGMEGRWNSGPMDNSDTRYIADQHGSNSLTGVKDVNVKLNAIFNDKTEGYIQYEKVKDNDSSVDRLIAGDVNVTGHPDFDYKLLKVKVKHQYRPNTSFGLSYTKLTYDNSMVDNLTNSGSWDRVRAEVEVRF